MSGERSTSVDMYFDKASNTWLMRTAQIDVNADVAAFPSLEEAESRLDRKVMSYTAGYFLFGAATLSYFIGSILVIVGNNTNDKGWGQIGTETENLSTNDVAWWLAPTVGLALTTIEFIRRMSSKKLALQLEKVKQVRKAVQPSTVASEEKKQ